MHEQINSRGSPGIPRYRFFEEINIFLMWIFAGVSFDKIEFFNFGQKIKKSRIFQDSYRKKWNFRIHA